MINNKRYDLKFIEDLLFNKAGNPENYAERYPNSTNEELKEAIDSNSRNAKKSKYSVSRLSFRQ